MKPILPTLAASVALLSGLSQVCAQYAPPPPPAPFKGFVNEWLARQNPALTNFDLGGSVRLREEIKDGFAIPGVANSVDFRAVGGDVDNNYLLSKVRFHAGYADTWWGAYVEGRSSTAIDDKRFAYANAPAVAGTVKYQGDGPESDSIDLHQAFLMAGNLKQFPLSLKVGRQELSYGEERLIGAFAWNNIGRTFDAAKMRLQTPAFAADFFASRPVIPEDGRFNVPNDYDWFSGVYATVSLVPKHSLELYLLSRNASLQAPAAEPRPQFPQPSARDIYTAGGRLKSAPGQLGPWDYTLEGAYQFGDYRDPRLVIGGDSPRLRQDAFMAIAQGGYTFTDTWAKPRLGMEYSYSSGDNNPTDHTHRTFDNLFPTNHKFYGYMDFISLQNIQDVRGIFQLRPHPRVSLAVEGHGFWLANTHDSFYNVGGVPRGGLSATAGDNYGINPNYGSFVGTELDVIAGWAVTRFAQLEVGYGHFFVGDYIRESLSAVGSQDANYVYLQATVNF